MLRCTLTYKPRQSASAFTLNAELTAPSKGLTAIYGPSGAGKTTLLRCIAGLEQAGTGTVKFNDYIWQQSGPRFTPSQHRFVAPHQRGLAYVFQEASLFPHLSCLKNLRYAVKRSAPERQITTMDEVVDLLAIAPLLHQYPQQLSGGERQRVAIARALLTQPQLLLMDEPLASLDKARKQDVLPYLETLKEQLKLPIIYVSHSLQEVTRLADTLVLMDQGRVLSVGPLATSLARLDSPLDLGDETGVVITAIIKERQARWQLANCHYEGGNLWLADRGHTIESTVRIRVLAKDVSIALSHHQDSSIINVLPARIEHIRQDEHSGRALVSLLSGNTPILARITLQSLQRLQLKQGMSVWAQVKSAALIQ